MLNRINKSPVLIVALIFSGMSYATTDQQTQYTPEKVYQNEGYNPDAPYAPSPTVFKSYVRHYLHNQSNYHLFEVFLIAGPSSSELSNNANVTITEAIPVSPGLQINTYNPNVGTESSLTGGFGAGIVFPLFDHNLTISLDPAFYYNNEGKVQGVDNPDSNFGSNPTYDYHFYADTSVIMLESHIVLSKYSWQPVLVVGYGNAWNTLYGFNETPTPGGGASPSTFIFQDNTLSSGAYEVGFGVQHQIYADDRHGIAYDLSLAYRYFNFGPGKLAQASGQNGNDVLQINTLDAQTLLLSITASFN